MCGIAVQFYLSSSEAVAETGLGGMAGAIEHRGPDAKRVYAEGPIRTASSLQDSSMPTIAGRFCDSTSSEMWTRAG